MAQHSPRFLKIVDEIKAHICQCTVADVRARREAAEQFHLIDVREDHEWDQGHVPGALHLGKGILERDIEQCVPDPQAPIVLYCGGGFRSALAAHNLQQMGYTNVVSMDGGFRGWKEAGLPVAE